jgi:hypothetical protein
MLLEMKRKGHKEEPAEVLRGWFDLDDPTQENLSDSQQLLLEMARERLEGLSPAGATPEHSWASLEPHYDTWGRPTGQGTLWLCVPIAGKRHDSLQVGLGRNVIVGGWQDRHYAWDDDRQEAFRSEVAQGAAAEPISEALNWLEDELRRRGVL